MVQNTSNAQSHYSLVSGMAGRANLYIVRVPQKIEKHVTIRSKGHLARITAEKTHKLATNALTLWDIDWTLPPAYGNPPVWPPDLIGSISHSLRYGGVILLRANANIGIGIDIEEVDESAAFVKEVFMNSTLKDKGDPKDQWVLNYCLGEACFKASTSIFHEVLPFHPDVWCVPRNTKECNRDMHILPAALAQMQPQPQIYQLGCIHLTPEKSRLAVAVNLV